MCKCDFSVSVMFNADRILDVDVDILLVRFCFLHSGKKDLDSSHQDGVKGDLERSLGMWIVGQSMWTAVPFAPRPNHISCYLTDLNHVPQISRNSVILYLGSSHFSPS